MSVIPHITVSNATAAIDFYQRAFGAKVQGVHHAPNSEKVMHAALEINGGQLMLNDDFPEYCGGKSNTPEAIGGTATVLHLQVPDVDAVYQQAVNAGATATMPPSDMFWGDRYGQLRDPFGHTWSIATAVRKLTEEELNQAASEVFKADAAGR